MHQNLSSYDKYLKKASLQKISTTISTHFIFNSQSAYQSLVSQKMQLESQITQFTSDKVTKAADFDNQISNQQNQINDFKNQLVESDAKRQCHHQGDNGWKNRIASRNQRANG